MDELAYAYAELKRPIPEDDYILVLKMYIGLCILLGLYGLSLKLMRCKERKKY